MYAEFCQIDLILVDFGPSKNLQANYVYKTFKCHRIVYLERIFSYNFVA